MGRNMQKLGVYLRYDWPLHFLLWITNGLPDNVIFLRLRGWLVKPFLGKCDGNLRIGRFVDIYNPSMLRLGRDIYIAYGCVFLANSEITVGDEVLFGPYAVISSSNHTRINRSYRYGRTECAPVSLGRGVWVGAHSVITAGSIVGEGSVVAAGAVVAEEVPADVIVGGVPAKVIKRLGDE